jgi:hypothetical protein
VCAAARPQPGEEEGISELRRQIEELQSAVLDYQQRFIELRRGTSSHARASRVGGRSPLSAQRM